MSTISEVVDTLFDGEIDIIGDIHGEYQAFRDLLGFLGYDERGNHPQGRRLVFVGDLVDRGPNSPQVVEDVMRMVQDGIAQCVLGNHELNILMGHAKDGNGWLCDAYEQVGIEKGWVYQWEKRATPEQHQKFFEFFAQLPLGLERKGDFPLRVVHALWDTKIFQNISIQTDIGTDCLKKDELLKQSITQEEKDLIKQFKETYNLHDQKTPPPFCSTMAEVDSRIQMSNPIKVATSGSEGPIAGNPEYLSGKYRMVERLRWWDSYEEGIPVVFGHYWRTTSEELSDERKRLFEHTTYDGWLGKNKDTYCIDFSVGHRYKERKKGILSNFEGQLAALRVPSNIDEEWTVMLSNGQQFSLPPIRT